MDHIYLHLLYTNEFFHSIYVLFFELNLALIQTIPIIKFSINCLWLLKTMPVKKYDASRLQKIRAFRLFVLVELLLYRNSPQIVANKYS